MGVLWSSPYRLQVFVICLGLLLLTAAFVLLLLSIGLGDFHWRLVGGVCASTGSALLVIGSCWCVWVVRRGRFAARDNLTVGVAPESEAQTLTSDATWREEAGLDGPCLDSVDDDHELGPDDEFDEDDSDDEDEDEDEDEDDDEDEVKLPPSGEEEEEDSLSSDVCNIDKRYSLRDRGRTGLKHAARDDDPTSVETKEEESRLIPV